MLHALLDTDFGTCEVLKSSDGERKSGVFLHHDGEETSSTFTLERILLVQLSAENGSSGLSFSAHTVSGRGVDIEVDNISCGEFPVLNSLFGSLLINNALIAINEMLLGLVRKNTLHWLDLVVSAHSSNLGGDFLVVAADLDKSGSSQESVISSKNNIGLFAVGLTSDSDGVTAVGSVAIDVASELNFDNILGLEESGIVLAWGVVSADLVD